MGQLDTIVIFVAVLNVVMWFSGLGMAEANPGGVWCYNVEGSIIDNAVVRSGNLSLGEDPMANLPDAQGGIVQSGDQNIFTDIFNNIIDWFKDLPGVKYVRGAIAAPYNVLRCMGAPDEFAAGIGTIWYLFSFLVLLGFLWGR